MTTPQVQCGLLAYGDILQDDLDKTIVSVALGCSSTIGGTKRLASFQPPRIQLPRKIDDVSRLRRAQNGSAWTLILARGWRWTPTSREPAKRRRANAYEPDRKHERPAVHLSGFGGILQVDGYGGYKVLADKGQARLAFCWAHVRRKFFEIQAARGADRRRGARAHRRPLRHRARNPRPERG